MKFQKNWILLILGLSLATSPALAQGGGGKPASKLHWKFGPYTANLQDIAEIKVPEGYMFLEAGEARTVLESWGNRTTGMEQGLLMPTNTSWVVVFEYNPSGYVKDDEKDHLDADKILKSYRDGTEKQNEHRKEMGIPPLHVVGWEQPPKYNSETHNLEWAMRAESAGAFSVNYNTRLLGRKGVMELLLLVDADKLTQTIPEFQALLQNYSYKEGQRYAEYKKGDKIAQYGLAALITGGAAVVAVKTGLFAWLILFLKKAWKLVAVGVAAIGAFIKKLVTGDRSNKQS